MSASEDVVQDIINNINENISLYKGIIDIKGTKFEDIVIRPYHGYILGERES